VISLKFLGNDEMIPFKNLSNFLSEIRYMLIYKGQGIEVYSIYYVKFYEMGLKKLDEILGRIEEIS
jgi:hypothetical protein